MIYEAIKNFPKQFLWQPEVNNGERLESKKSVIVAGMGGSALSAMILSMRFPKMSIVIHRDYGLPALPDEVLRDSLLIASSYSGNTEETISAFHEAQKIGMATVAVSIGGKLLELARANSVPYVQMPDTGIEPRLALGFSIKAILQILSQKEAMGEATLLADALHSAELEASGKDLAEDIRGAVPVIYASTANLPVAYNWKITFNESAKTPAFHNVFPELNHNEMTGFDWTSKNKFLSEKFHFIFLEDKEDNLKIQKRMRICKTLYGDLGLPVTVLELKGQSIFHKVFSSLLLANWAAYHTAIAYGAEPEAVPLVEKLKKLMEQE